MSVDTSRAHVEQMAATLPECQAFAPRLYRAADTLRALLAERDALIHDIERAKASESALLAERDAARAEGYRQGQENMRSRIASPLFLRPLVDEQSAGEWYEETLAADTQMYADAILAVPLAPEGSS